MKCPNCESENPKGAAYCRRCGQRLSPAEQHQRGWGFGVALVALGLVFGGVVVWVSVAGSSSQRGGPSDSSADTPSVRPSERREDPSPAPAPSASGQHLARSSGRDGSPRVAQRVRPSASHDPPSSEFSVRATPDPRGAGGPLKGLRSHFTFDGTASDSGPARNHGSPEGGVVYVAGKIGRAVLLDGSKDGIRLGGALGLHGTDWTVALWVKSTTRSRTFVIHSWGPEGKAKESFTLHISDSAHVVSVFQSGEGALASIPVTDALDGNWHHIAFARTVERGAPHGMIRGYLDARLVHSSRASRPQTRATKTAIGCCVGDYSPNTRYQGLIDDLRVYERALSLGEIRELARGG